MTDLCLPPLQDMLAWLGGLPAGLVIGQRLELEGCPLHTWLCTVFPASVVVDEETITVALEEGTTQVIPTPDDYRAVMERLDHLGGFESGIRVDETREALREVIVEYKE